MALAKEGSIRLSQIVDSDGNPAAVSLSSGVYRLAVDAVIAGPGGAYSQGDFDSAAANESNALAMWVRAAVTGLDTSQAVGSRNVPISARPFNTPLGTQVAGTLEGLTTNARLAGYRLGGTDWGAVYSDAPSQASGAAIGNFVGLYTNAVLCAVRSSVLVLPDASASVAVQAYTRERLMTDAVARGDDGTTYSAINARAFNNGAVDETKIGLLTRSALSVYDATASVNSRNLPVDAVTLGDASPLVASGVSDIRESAFRTAIAGKRFVSTHQTPGTSITAPSATFSATAPGVILYNSAGNTTKVVARAASIFVTNASVSPVSIAIAIDTADRYASGGTAHTPQNVNEASATASGVTGVRTGATASAAGAGTRYIFNGQVPAGAGVSLEALLKDGVLIDGVGSILIYVWDSAGSVAPTFFWNLDWSEK